MSLSRFSMPAEIRTSRLRLRSAHPDAAEAQVEAIAASLPELSRWLPWAQETQGLTEARMNLDTARQKFESGEEYNYLIYSAAADTFLGRISLFRINPQVPKGEIGYWLATAHAGQGYMLEATKALTEEALRQGMRRIEIRCDSQNERSARIPLLLGYQFDALLKNDDVAANDPATLRDTLVFSITK